MVGQLCCALYGRQGEWYNANALDLNVAGFFWPGRFSLIELSAGSAKLLPQTDGRTYNGERHTNSQSTHTKAVLFFYFFILIIASESVHLDLHLHFAFECVSVCICESQKS